MKFHLAERPITWFMRFAIFVRPGDRVHHHPALGLALQRHDRDLLLHGYETGVIVRAPDGRLHRAAPPDQPSRRLHAHRTPTRRDRHRPSCRDRRERRTAVAAPARRRMRAKLSRGLVRRRRAEADGRGARGGPAPRRARPRAGGRSRPPGPGSRVRRPPAPRRRRRPAPLPLTRQKFTPHDDAGTRQKFTPYDADPAQVHPNQGSPARFCPRQDRDPKRRRARSTPLRRRNPGSRPGP